MTASERREEILRILADRRTVTMRGLAETFGVTTRTIRNDITALTAEYPLETTRGNGGGVKLAEWYRPHKAIFSQEQTAVLEQLMEYADAYQAEVLRRMLDAFGASPKPRGAGDHIPCRGGVGGE